jgi:hypothetical protein
VGTLGPHLHRAGLEPALGSQDAVGVGCGLRLGLT